MDLAAIFKPVQDKKGIKLFVIWTLIVAAVYFTFSIVITLIFTKPFPEGAILDIILFAIFKNISTFTNFDFILLALFPLSGGLLMANYKYYKCRSISGSTGLTIGLLAAICPVCLLPIIGVTSVLVFVTKIGVYIKLGALLLIIGSTYYVAVKVGKCKTNKKI